MRPLGAQVLLMDAGDFSQGSTSVNVSEGATAVELMNMAGYDVATTGNHEFDFGYANLKTLMESAEFPILAADAFTAEGDLAMDGDNLTFQLGDVTVGVFGLATPETATKAHPAKLEGRHLPGRGRTLRLRPGSRWTSSPPPAATTSSAWAN